MTSPSSSAALQLLERGDLAGSLALVNQGLAANPNDPGFLFVLGNLFLHAGKFPEAVEALQRSLQGDASNDNARFVLAMAHKRLATHRGYAVGRDLLLELVGRREVGPAALREAAELCSWVGPFEKAVELWGRVAAQSGQAEDHFRLSEILALTDRLPEAVAALKEAVRLDPEKYAKSLHDLELAQGGQGSPKKARYPDTEVLCGDLRRVLLDHVAADLHDCPKFITLRTRFFTMGSCFARNLVRSLSKAGYDAHSMEISEYINSSYANRHFVDWLEGALPPGSVSDRIAELLPPDFSREKLLEMFRTCDVFILTLGVAPAFFDRETGAFVLPRPTALNSRALAEKYRFRTTSVQENVDNVCYQLSFLRKLNPGAKIVITESPVPLHMTFEFKSAVVADCLSKSTLRVAADQIVNHSGFRDIYYWPSFEVFRWVGSHRGGVYAVDDGASWHVSEAAVDVVVQAFVETFSAPAAPSA